MMKLFNNRNKGFTLIEILIVIIVIGILVAMAIPSIGGIKKQAADSVNNANIQTLESLTEAYCLLNSGKYPTAGGDAQSDLIVKDLLKKSVVGPPGYSYSYVSSGTWSIVGP